MTTHYMTTEEVAELARTTPATVAFWRHNGKGPKGTRVGRRILYRSDHVEAWLAASEDGAA